MRLFGIEWPKTASRHVIMYRGFSIYWDEVSDSGYDDLPLVYVVKVMVPLGDGSSMESYLEEDSELKIKQLIDHKIKEGYRPKMDGE